jgi:hypothetical protein
VVDQIKASLRRKNYKEAISLLEEFEADGEISKDMLSFVHAQLGFLLFFDLRFEDAVNHFLLSETLLPSEIFPFIMWDPNCWSDLVCFTAHGNSEIAFEIVDSNLLKLNCNSHQELLSTSMACLIILPVFVCTANSC